MPLDFFETFFKWNGKFVDVDMNYGPQCMDWLHKYLEERYGLDRTILASPVAVDVFTTFPGIKGSSLFKKYINFPWSIPKQGDLMFWGAPYGAYWERGVKKYAGHVAIFNEGGVWRFTSIDQNWPTNTPVHVQEHNYWGVKGWLRKIEA